MDTYTDPEPRGSSLHLRSSADLQESAAPVEQQQQPSRCRRWCVPIGLGVGCLLVIGTVLFGVLLPAKLNSSIDGTANICNSASEGFDHWRTNDPSNTLGIQGPFTPRYQLFYAWNLTNPEGYLRGEKAVLKETGPYAFRRYETKFDISFTDTTQKYRTWNRLVFEPSQSCDECKVDDPVTNLNPVYLGAITLANGKDSFFNLVAGVPYFTATNVKASDQSCRVADPPYANPTFPSYANASCAALSTSINATTMQTLNQAICCVLSDGPKAAAILSDINNGLASGDIASAIASASTIIQSCGFDTSVLGDSFLEFVLCLLGYWGVENPLISVGPGNLAAQVLADTSPSSFQNTVLSTDGLVTTKTVSEWYLGGPSKLGQILLGEDWPGYADNHHKTLEEAKADPKCKYDVVYSGCGDSKDAVANYINSSGVNAYNYSYWSDNNIMVNVGGGTGTQTVPRGVSGFGGEPYSSTEYIWVAQLKRPVALYFTGTVDIDGIQANKFEIKNFELAPEGNADLPGRKDVPRSSLGVGHKTCKRKASCLEPFNSTEAINGLVDVTPHEGFAAFVSRPYYDGTDVEILNNATLLPRADGHEFPSYMAIEPASGKTISAHSRLQLNAAVVFNSDIFYPNLSTSVGVILAQWWLDETASLTTHDVHLVKEIITLYDASRWSLYLGPAIGALIMCIGLYFMVAPACRRDTHTSTPDDFAEEDDRRSSLIQSEHTKSGDLESGSWHERCSRLKDVAGDITRRLSESLSASSSSADEESQLRPENTSPDFV